MIDKQEELIAEGALALLVEVLKVHKECTTICEPAVVTLKYIVMGRDVLKEAVVLAGALPILVEMLEVHKAHAAICDQASIVLWFIARVDSLKASIVSAGAVPALAAVLKYHLGSAKLSAYDTLRILGFNDDGSKV